MQCWTCKEEKKEFDFHKGNRRCKKCYQDWYRKNRGKECQNCKIKFIGRSEFCSNRCKLLHHHIKTEKRCWEFKGYISPDGYALIRDIENKKHILAHRLSYQIFNGEIPEKMLVCHHCDNRKCINPEHLFLGTHQDNSDDAKSKNRIISPGRKNHGKRKLNKILVIKIRKWIEEGISCLEIARRLNVTSDCIYDIKYRKTWKHIE